MYIKLKPYNWNHTNWQKKEHEKIEKKITNQVM